MGTHFSLFLKDPIVWNFSPSLAPPRNAKVSLDGRGKISWMVCLSFVKHGLHMVLWTWPSGCGVHQSGGQGHPKRRCQFQSVQARGALESGALLAPVRLKYQSCARSF